MYADQKPADAQQPEGETKTDSKEEAKEGDFKEDGDSEEPKS